MPHGEVAPYPHRLDIPARPQLLHEVSRAQMRHVLREGHHVDLIHPQIHEQLPPLLENGTTEAQLRVLRAIQEMPGITQKELARFLGLLYRVVPKIGPLKPLSFKTPTPEAEKLFEESFKATHARYAAALDAVARGRIDVANTDFDTGRPTRRGEYALADKTYGELVHRLSKSQHRQASTALRRNIGAFYGSPAPESVDRARISEHMAAKQTFLLTEQESLSAADMLLALLGIEPQVTNFAPAARLEAVKYLVAIRAERAARRDQAVGEVNRAPAAS